MARDLASTIRRTARLVRSLWLMILVGLLIRFVLMPITFDGDLVTYAEAAAGTSYGQSLYSYSFVYPPMWGLYLVAIGHLVAPLAAPPTWLTTSPALQGLYASSSSLVPGYEVNLTFVVVEKSSILVFDLLTGLTLYVLAVRISGREATGRTAFALWFLNPLVILTTALHGAFDIIPTFCALAAFALCLEKSYGFSGAMIGIGTLFKDFPIFLVPLLIAIAWRVSRNTGGSAYRAVGSLAVGLAIASLPVLLGPGLISGYLSNSTAAISGNAVRYGGIGFWGLISLPSLQFVSTDLNRDATLTTVVLSSFAALIAIGAAVLVACSKKLDHAQSLDWLYGPVIALAGAYLLTSFGQPQYAIWILPFVLLLALRSRVFLGLFWVLTMVSVLVYLLFIAGPLFFFLPLWYYFHVISLQTYANSITYWKASFIPTYGPWLGVVDAVALFGVLALAIVRALPRKPSRVPAAEV